MSHSMAHRGAIKSPLLDALTLSVRQPRCIHVPLPQMAKSASRKEKKEAATEDKGEDSAVAVGPEITPPSQSAACAAEVHPATVPERRAAAGTADIRMAPHGFLAGEIVVVHGLLQQKEHNGRRAVVLEDDALAESQRGRVPVMVQEHTPIFGKHSPAMQVAIWPSSLRRAASEDKRMEDATTAGKWAAPREKFKKRGR